MQDNITLQTGDFDITGDGTGAYELPDGNSTQLTRVVPMELIQYKSLALDNVENIPELFSRLAMLTSYTEVASQPMNELVNSTIDVVGMCLQDVPSFIERSTGEQKPGYRNLLIKILVDGRPVVLRTGARHAIQMAQEVLLPYLGWLDWPDGPYKFKVESSGGMLLLRPVK